ncbi:MAG: 3-deoxy-D-manno-octulosonic acid transferase, partial [Chromatiales bacterium]|nr:3-deoxy-D-manno-octulosonic acid transferase [Chromatiales bacterium]
MHTLYNTLTYLVLPWAVLRLLWRGVINRRYWKHCGERFGFVTSVPVTGTCRVWFHAVSVGEVQAAVPLVSALLRAQPDCEVWLTTTTPTGRERVKQALGDRVRLSYVPYDTPDAVARFLARITPHVLVIMETEIWPNLIAMSVARQLPVVLVNARLSARSHAKYQRFAGLVEGTFGQISACAAQTDADAERLVSLGIHRERVKVTGSIKFDVRIPPSVRERGAVLRRIWGVDRSVFIAASTHEGEEAVVLGSFADILERHPKALLVLVPRHPERFARVAALARRRGYVTVQHSDAPVACADA